MAPVPGASLTGETGRSPPATWKRVDGWIPHPLHCAPYSALYQPPLLHCSSSSEFEDCFIPRATIKISSSDCKIVFFGNRNLTEPRHHFLSFASRLAVCLCVHHSFLHSFWHFFPSCVSTTIFYSSYTQLLSFSLLLSVNMSNMTSCLSNFSAIQYVDQKSPSFEYQFWGCIFLHICIT